MRRSGPTGPSRVSSRPRRTRGRRAPGRRNVHRHQLGQQPQPRGGAAPQPARTRATRSATPSAVVAGSVPPSIRGSAPSRWCRVVASPRPAAPTGPRWRGAGRSRTRWGHRGAARPGCRGGPPAGCGSRASAPPSRRVDPIGEPAAGKILQDRLERLEVAADRAPPVDDEDDVAIAVAGVACGVAQPVAVDIGDPVRAEVLSRDRRMPTTSATTRATTSPWPRVATPLTCGRSARSPNEPPPKSRTYTCTSRGVAVRASEHTSVLARWSARARPTHDADMPTRPGEVEDQGVPALLQRPVEQPHRHPQHPRARASTLVSPTPGTTARSGRRASSEAGRSSGAATPGARAARPAIATATASSRAGRSCSAAASATAGLPRPPAPP